jgi:hypothetical protein
VLGVEGLQDKAHDGVGFVEVPAARGGRMRMSIAPEARSVETATRAAGARSMAAFGALLAASQFGPLSQMSDSSEAAPRDPLPPNDSRGQ